MTKFFKRIGILFCLIMICFSVYVIIETPFLAIKNLSNTVVASFDEVENINKKHVFGKFVKANYSKEKTVSINGNSKINVNLKLFNLFDIKSFEVDDSQIDVYAGGSVIGFTLNGDGVVVLGKSNVETESGDCDTTKNSNIKIGDIIKKIEGEKIQSIADIYRVANKNENKNRELDICLTRSNNEIHTKIFNAYDKNSGIYKLGLWVKDDVSGIGTLTYVRSDNNRFGALGHSIYDNDTKTIYDISDGEAYNCMVIGLNKGCKGRAGELKGIFVQGKNNKIGTIDKNCEFGVFGKIDVEKTKQGELLKAGGRLSAKPGKAYIRCCFDGKECKDYEIEIIKTNYQSRSSEKSMVIKVTDSELLQKTGGIIQGMSGSPIIQDGKIIGAVTHVFLNDPTKGFGIYLDWMINN